MDSKLDQNFKPGMTGLQIFMAGGNAWLIEQYRIIQDQLNQLEDEECNIII